MTIVRAIAAVIVGYLAMFVVIFATFTGAYLAMGTEGAFKEGSYDVSTLWIVLSCVVGLIAAVVGGVVAAFIAERGSKAPMVLAGLVVVLGLAMAVPVLMDSGDSTPAVRGGDVDNLEAMQNAKQPPLVALANPIIGAIGIMIGVRLSGRGGAISQKATADSL